MIAGLWAYFTVLAAGGQTLRNALQRELTQTLGTVGATHVRFLYGLPFGVLFLALILWWNSAPLPALTPRMFGWTFLGAITQIIATALLLAAMREKNFVVITALSKTEPAHVALFGLLFLGEKITPLLGLAILVATAGVLIMSWPKQKAEWTPRPILLGLFSASVFGLSAVGFRQAILTPDAKNFAVAASTTLVLGLTIQVAVLSSYLFLFDRPTLIALFKAWRPSIKAGFMGAFASQMWFLAFSLESPAKVRTLALIEVLFAQVISRSLFKQSLASREAAGVALIVVGVILLLNA